MTAFSPSQGNALKNSAVNIVINATDNASKGINGTKLSFVGLSNTVKVLSASMTALSVVSREVSTVSFKAILGTAYTLINVLGTLAGSFNNIQQLLSNPSVSPFLELFSKELTDATKKAVKLSDATKALVSLVYDVDKFLEEPKKSAKDATQKDVTEKNAVDKEKVKPDADETKDLEDQKDRLSPVQEVGKKAKSIVEAVKDYSKTGSDAAKEFNDGLRQRLSKETANAG
ncbi:MAG TPA: hypothetical protein V6C65_27760, partial [Allocoleopsis sp.]